MKRPPDGDDTEMNMTPMIDIVFQLIIFFMLTLKFKTVDRRIESMLPKDRGLAPTPTFPPDFLKVKIKVFRRGLETANTTDDDYTLVKVDNSGEFQLPAGWKGLHKEPGDRVKRYESVIATVQKLVRDKIQAHGGKKEEVKGEIVAPPPKGGAVPHGDVMQMLNIFLVEGITDVVFEGAATPLTSKERAALGGGATE
jgi:biopolymer transport protein ExbD